MFSVNLINSGKWKASRYSFLLQQLILQLPTHSHNLLEQFLNAMAVKRIMCQCTKTLQFLLLPLPVQNFFPIGNLVLCHPAADIHPLFKEIYHGLVDGVNFFPKFV